MKKTINTTHVIDAPAEEVWQRISQATGVNDWLPIGTGVGAQRVCTTEQGDMNETILVIDHENRIFQYTINEQPLSPVEDIVGTMRVGEKNGRTELRWSLDFTLPDETQFPAVQQAVEALYAAGAHGLETLATP